MKAIYSTRGRVGGAVTVLALIASPVLAYSGNTRDAGPQAATLPTLALEVSEAGNERAVLGEAFPESSFIVELEAGAVWQSRNDVQIPNDQTGTRFSLIDVTGNGPWPTGRLHLTWNISRKHGLRGLLAPLSIAETGNVFEPVNFAGRTYVPGVPIETTYQFNSWRLTYHYRFLDRQNLRLWVGFTAKIRDAKIELSQGDTTSRDTDIGFVPLLHLAADWRFTSRWRLLFDFDGLAGGPGRAFDSAVKLGRDFGPHWRVTAGYRMLEGGADVDAVYNFAWLHYAVLSGSYRF